MLVYLDLCSIQRPLDDRAQLRVHIEAEAVLRIIAACEAGQAALLSSDALEYEAARNPNPVRHAYSLGVLSKAARIIRLSTSVEEKANVFSQAGLRPLDALHLAFATEAVADYFCTCDDRLYRRAKTLQAGSPRIVNPVELVSEISR